MATPGTEPARGCDFVYLLGGTPLEEYLDFMGREPVEKVTDPEILTPAWKAAQAARKKLRRREAEWADFPELRPVPEALRPLLERVKADPYFCRAFTLLPTAFAVVELDRLVVRQKTINLYQVARLERQLGPAPSPEAVFRFCFPIDQPVPPPRVAPLPEGGFEFLSPSNDLRFLEAVVLRPEQVRDYQPFGPAAAVLGLVVGYGTNFLNAIAAEGRLVLHNGSHRAYALRRLGVTHAPCLIQHARTDEELMRVAMGALRRYPDVYLREPRPPVFKDYFNPQLCRTVRLPETVRHVQVRFTPQEFDRAETWEGT
ncbi:MAG TPA: hypothetical protein VJ739_09980 [Gemmataceae bacterium]|nr:hypothetical protein [Gemmataceae bacterium]